MPLSDQGTFMTYTNANTLISGNMSRSVCAVVRASTSNVQNIIFDIGSHHSTYGSPTGCNEHFALLIRNATQVM